MQPLKLLVPIGSHAANGFVELAEFTHRVIQRFAQGLSGVECRAAVWHQQQRSATAIPFRGITLTQ